MSTSRVVGFNPTRLAEKIFANVVKEQNRRLVKYAKQEIKRLGDLIQTYNSENHMDRTGNLLNSLCWGLTYRGEMVDSGFYRPPKTNMRVNRWGQERGMGVQGGSSSYLHEWFSDDMEEVNGRQMAENFVKEYKGRSKGWSVFFAVLAPYWGYWESGHTNKRTGRFVQFQVMSHIFDDVRTDLKPAETHLTVYVPKYIYKSRKWKRKLKNGVGIKRIGVDR